MNPRVARLLIRLYPARWRERYGEEFEALLRAGSGDFPTLTNVVWSALRERVIPTPGLDLAPAANHDPGSFPFQSFCKRAPWAMFGLAPLLVLACAYLIACFLLWSGWEIFLPGTNTPFGGRIHGPIYGFENIYFQADKFFYFGAPVLVGWVIGLIAVRQRVNAVWPTAGLILTAWMGGAAQIQANRTAVPGFGHIRMNFALGSSAQNIPSGLIHALAIFSLTALPYLLLRFLIGRAKSE